MTILMQLSKKKVRKQIYNDWIIHMKTRILTSIKEDFCNLDKRIIKNSIALDKGYETYVGLYHRVMPMK